MTTSASGPVPICRWSTFDAPGCAQYGAFVEDSTFFATELDSVRLSAAEA